MKKNFNKKGFTLVELLIVIAVLAVLATVVVLVLNPAQLLAEARDGQRLNDMGTLRSALTLYLASVSSPTLGTDCTNDCYNAIGGVAANCGGRYTAARITTTDTTREVDGTGWLPVNFTTISSGAPFSTLPIDPAQSTTLFYAYACDSTALTFELTANMESDRYETGGGSDAESNTEDGGNTDTIFETGSDPGLNL